MDEVGNGCRDGHWVQAQADSHVAGGFVGLYGVGPESGDFHERLGVEKKEGSGDAVGQGFAGAGEEFPQPGQTLVLGYRGSCFRGVVAHFNAVVHARVLDEDDESADLFSCCGSGGEPGFDVLLGAGRCCSLVRFPEPGQEFDGFGDLLFGRVHRAAGVLFRCCRGPDASEVVPGCEVLDWFGDLLGQRVELVFDPGFEPGQVGVLIGEQPVVDKQGP